MNTKDLDVVYVVKDSAFNDELRYSLRSVEKNFPCNRVWFYGGRPIGAHPDKQVIIHQTWGTKWDNVRNMLRKIAENDEITEDFVLFNDDFFVMKPVENLPPYKWKSMESLWKGIERRNGGRPSTYTKNMKKVAEELTAAGYGTDNYALHLPMVFNRKKMLEMLDTFPDTRSPRSVYGNMFLKKDAKSHKDVKIFRAREIPPKDPDYLSTEDFAFENGKVGEFIRQRFPEKSRWEK